MTIRIVSVLCLRVWCGCLADWGLFVQAALMVMALVMRALARVLGGLWVAVLTVCAQSRRFQERIRSDCSSLGGASAGGSVGGGVDGEYQPNEL